MRSRRRSSRNFATRTAHLLALPLLVHCSPPAVAGPQSLATGEDALAMVIDGTQIYLLEQGRIVAVPTTGGAPRVVTTCDNGCAPPLLLDGSRLVFGAVHPAPNPSSRATIDVATVPTAGGTPTVILSAGIDPRFTLGHGEIFWSDSSICGSTRVNSLAADGTGTPAMLLSLSACVSAMAVGSDAVYVASGDFNRAQITRIPFDGTAPIAIPTMRNRIHWIDVTATDLYFTAENSSGASLGNLFRMPIAGGTSTSLAPMNTDIDHVAIDAADAWFVERGTSSGVRILRTALDGATPSVTAATLTADAGTDAGTGAALVAVDATSVFFSVDSALWRAPKPLVTR